MKYFGILLMFVSSAAVAHIQIVDSATLSTDKPVLHMVGPESIKDFTLDKAKGISWITEASVTAVEGKRVVAPENLCHAWIQNTFIKKAHSQETKERNTKYFRATDSLGSKLFTLDMKMPSVKFPSGFGIPIAKNDSIRFLSSLATHGDFPDGKTVTERYRLQLKYVDDSPEMTALYRVSLPSVTHVSGNSCVFNRKPAGKASEKGCLKFELASDILTMEDRFGGKFSAHFLVGKGHHTIVTEVTHFLNLDSDSRIHFIGAHVHHGVTKVRLLEGKEKREIYKVEQESHGHGGHHKHGSGAPLPVYSNTKGKRIKADTPYFLETTIHNSSENKIDIMSVLHLYIRDKKFRRLASN